MSIHSNTVRRITDDMPDGWTGIRWRSTGWVDCRAYVETTRFAWEMWVYADEDIDVEAVVGEAACTSPLWCPECPSVDAQQLALTRT